MTELLFVFAAFLFNTGNDTSPDFYNKTGAPGLLVHVCVHLSSWLRKQHCAKRTRMLHYHAGMAVQDNSLSLYVCTIPAHVLATDPPASRLH